MNVLSLDPGGDHVGWAWIDADAARAAKTPAELGASVVSFGVEHGPGASKTHWASATAAKLLDGLPSYRPTWVACEEPPPKIHASDFAGNSLRALVVQGQVGGLLLGAIAARWWTPGFHRDVVLDLEEVVQHAGIWRPCARIALANVGVPYGPGFPLPSERPIPRSTPGKPLAFDWPCGHSTGFGASWCTVCAPVKDTRTCWKASATTAAARLLGDRWETFAAPARKRSRSAVRDHQRPGLHDAAEAVVSGLGTVHRLFTLDRALLEARTPKEDS